MAPFELRTMPTAQLLPAPYNPRRVLSAKSPAYRKLKSSLEEFGLVEPLIWNETTGLVVGGHLRLRILRELGIGAVPVSVVRLTPARERALNIVLNNQEAQGRYDHTKLAELLAELDVADLATLKQLFMFLPDPPDLFDSWEQLVSRHLCHGKMAHDARLVAAMQLHGVGRILTFNVTDFTRFPGIAVIDPATVAP